jgi:hypothetical protein
VIEKKGFDVAFQDGKSLIKPIVYNLNKAIVFGFRESKLYRIKDQSMRAMDRNRVAENKEQVAPKVENLRGSQPSGSSGKEKPSKSIENESWYEMSM